MITMLGDANLGDLTRWLRNKKIVKVQYNKKEQVLSLTLDDKTSIIVRTDFMAKGENEEETEE